MSHSKQTVNLDHTLAKAAGQESLEREEIISLLHLKDESDIEKVFAAARELRRRHFGNQVFLYGFIYFSTYCRNDCTFCFYRRSNKVSERYRKSKEEIVETAHQLVASGVHLLDLTMGEDPIYFTPGSFDDLLDVAEKVKINTGLPLMISPGVVPENVLLDFKRIGVDWFACYQETHNPALYAQLRLDQSYQERMDLKIKAHRMGFLIEEGLLAGIGESAKDIYDSISVMEQLNAEQVRVMSFVPQKGTPLEHRRPLTHLRELLIIAIMRIMFPDRLIPASLDVDGISGLKKRLHAGANVVTSIIPPHTGLLGVSQSTLDIDKGFRTVDGVVPVLEQCELQPAAKQSYLNWVTEAKGKQKTDPLSS